MNHLLATPSYQSLLATKPWKASIVRQFDLPLSLPSNASFAFFFSATFSICDGLPADGPYRALNLGYDLRGNMGFMCSSQRIGRQICVATALPSQDKLGDGTTVFYGDLYNSGQFTIIDTSVIVTGNYIQNGSQVLTFLDQATLVIQGCASLDGTLQINVTYLNLTANSSPETKDLITYQCVNGTFSKIELLGAPTFQDETNNNNNNCGGKQVTATPTYGSSSLTMLFTVENIPGSDDCAPVEPLNVPLIVGAVVGSVLGAALVFFALSLAIPPLRKKIFPFMNRSKSTKQQD